METGERLQVVLFFLWLKVHLLPVNISVEYFPVKSVGLLREKAFNCLL